MADFLYLSRKSTEGVTLLILVSGILTIVEVALFSFLSSSLCFRILASAISNLCHLDGFSESSSTCLVLLGIPVIHTQWMITSISVRAVLSQVCA